MHRLRAASPVTAVLLGTLGLALLAAWVPLTYLTGDVQVSRDGAAVVLAVGTGLLGLLVARRQPGNPEGWLLLGLAAAGEAGSIAGQHIQVDVNGNYTGPGSPTGVLGVLASIATPVFFVVPLFWPAFVARQVFSWRRSAGDRRQQLKWLMAGAVIGLAGVMLIVFGPPNDQLSGRVARDLAFVALAALPVSIGVGILKYRLYEIDRIISRTLAYAIVTGLLVGVYAGLVLLATQVFRVHTPVAVAASTLAAAALFNPVRRRVQQAVDRRFNRARYDADQTVAAFAARLKDAVDLDSVRDDLAGVVHQALEPAHVSVWISQHLGQPG